MLTSTFCPYSKPFTCSASPTTFGATSTKIPDFILFLTIPSTISPSLNFKIFCSNVPCNSLYDNSILPVSLSYFFTTTFILWPTCRISAAFCINISEIFSSFNIPVSFGDEERLRIAKKLIRGSLFSYAFILVLDLILSAISSLLT